MLQIIRALLPIFLVAASLLAAAEDDAFFAKDVSLNLRNPELCDGVLTTHDGGVVTAPDLRVQARSIESTRRVIDDEATFTLRAEGDLSLEYGDHVFTGTLLQYDFQKHRGVIYNACGMFHPWYVGAEYIQLLPNGDYRIYNGFLTTSACQTPDWQIAVGSAYLCKNTMMTAQNIKFMVARLPILWLPYLKTKISWLVDSPVRYRLRWGGYQGLRFGVSAKIMDYDWFRAFAMVDYRLSRGPGIALETQACHPDGSGMFLTRNYVARDSAIDDPNERFRYRFQGYYDRCLCDGNVNLNVTYDKISDEDMPTDYSDKDLELQTAQRTQVTLRSQNECGISDFRTRVRVNSFETLKEDLPYVGYTTRSLVLANTGVISENRVRIGFHDFRFSKLLPENSQSSDFSSTRTEFRHNLFRPFSVGCATITPNTGAVAIFYGNSEDNSSKWVALGQFGATATTQMYAHYGSLKHIIEPYVRYQYFTTPNNSPDQHFIFDLQDGWFRLNTMRFGTRNLIYQKCSNGCIAHRLTLDLYAYAFFDTPTIGSNLPRIYAEGIWDYSPSQRFTVLSVYNAEHNILDVFNLRGQWTVNQNLAVSAECRYRSKFYWRRSDPNNFVMDSFRSQAELLSNPGTSDKRSTLLLHTFYRIQSDLAIEFSYYHGWGRNHQLQPNYSEYEIDLLKTIRSTWHFRISYQQKENDHRVILHVKVGQPKPCCPGPCRCITMLE